MKFLPINKWLLCACVWFMAGVYALLIRESSSSDPHFFPHFDKLVHALLFFGQIWLFCKVFLVENRKVPIMILWVLALLCAVGSEWAQGEFTATREADVWDSVADMVGASCALLCAWVIQNVRNNRVKVCVNNKN